MLESARFRAPEGEGLPEKRWVARSFSHSAAHYDKVAELQRNVGERLLDQLPTGAFSWERILDAGAGTGYCTARLGDKFPDATLLAVDIAEGMLKILGKRPDPQGKTRRICGDVECLPLASGSIDLVFSNLALQWCVDLPAAFAEFRRVLRPGGILAFSTFGTATLMELRKAWSEADAYSHVNDFASLENIGETLACAEFQDVALEGEPRILAYPDVQELLRDLKGLGARNVTLKRPRHLTGKGVFRRMLDAYASSMPTGRVEATFEVVYGRARMIGSRRQSVS